MYPTRTVIRLLRDANPGVELTEDRIRHLLRREEIPTPSTFSGRLAWTDVDVQRLADALGIAAPARSPAAVGGAA